MGRRHPDREGGSEATIRGDSIFHTGAGAAASGRIGSITTERPADEGPLTVEGLRKRMRKHRERMTERGF